MTPAWTTLPHGLRLAVRVTPRAAREGLAGLVRDAAGVERLAVRVCAAPADGAANTAVQAVLARTLGVPRSHVVLEAGATAREKRFLVEGDPAVLAVRLRQCVEERTDHG